jgi:diaminopimelate decarboxylase
MVARVIGLTDGTSRRFMILDAALNDLIRPAMYGARHEFLPVAERGMAAPVGPVDVVGPVCESGDFLAKDRSLPEVKPGDLLAVMSAGAYGFVMASNYNSRPRVPEVLVKDNEVHVIRARESYDDLVRGETIPEFLS